MRIAKAVLTVELDGIETTGQLQAILALMRPAAGVPKPEDPDDGDKADPKPVVEPARPRGRPPVQDNTQHIKELAASYVLKSGKLDEFVRDAPSWQVMWLYKTLLGVASPQADKAPDDVMRRLEFSRADAAQVKIWQISHNAG